MQAARAAQGPSWWDPQALSRTFVVPWKTGTIVMCVLACILLPTFVRQITYACLLPALYTACAEVRLELILEQDSSSRNFT